jgi:hypothetical protein
VKEDAVNINVQREPGDVTKWGGFPEAIKEDAWHVVRYKRCHLGLPSVGGGIALSVLDSRGGTYELPPCQNTLSS